MVKIAVFGYGKMGEAFTEVFRQKAEVIVYDILPDRVEVAKSKGLQVAQSPEEAAKICDIAFISVRPGDIPTLAESIREHVKGKLIVSIAAGWSTDKLEQLFPEARVIRLMPNINIAVKYSVIALTPGKTARPEDVKLVKELLADAGYVFEVSEKLMDIITVLSGSGPALIAYIADALAWSGVLFGLDRDTALKLVAHVLIGTGKHLLERKPDEIMTMVATPGGVTIEALTYMDYEGLKGIIAEAVRRAIEKERKLTR